MGLYELPQLGTSPSGCSRKACLYRDFLPSQHCLIAKILLLTPPKLFMKQVCSSSSPWEVFFSFLSQGNSCRCLHCGLQPLLWPLWCKCFSCLCHWRHWPRAVEGNGEEILLEVERKGSLFCALLSTEIPLLQVTLRSWFSSAALGVELNFLSRLTTQPYLQHYFLREISFQFQTTLEVTFSNSVCTC